MATPPVTTPTAATPDAVKPIFENQVLTPDQEAQLNAARKAFDQIKNILKDSNYEFERNIASARVYTTALIENENALNKQAIQYGPVNQRMSEYRDTLTKSIEMINRFSSTLKTEYDDSLRSSAAKQADLIKSLVELNNAYPHAKTSFEDLADATSKAAARQEELLRGFDASSDEYTALQSDIEDLKKSMEGQVSITEEQIMQRIKNSALVEGERATEENAAKIRELILLQLRENLAIKKEQYMQNEAEEQQKRIMIQQDLSVNDIINRQNESLLSVESAVAKFAKKLGMANAESNLMSDMLIAMTKGFDKFGEAILKGMLKGFLEPKVLLDKFFTFLNTNLIKSTFEFDATLAQVNKTTGGMGREFEKVAMNQAGIFSASNVSRMANYGISLKDYGESYSALSAKMGNFNNMQDEERRLLSDQSSLLRNLSISAEMYASSVSYFMGSVGKTAYGANEAINRLTADAIGMGRNVDQYMRSFEQTLPKIVGFGREASKIFKELSALSAQTSGALTESDLATIADRFSNWDEAAESVSKLNAALGGTSVNIEDMIRADPTQKLLTLKRAFAESNIDFDRLNRGYQRLLAEALGVDINKASALFKMNAGEALALMSKQSAEQKEINERMQRSADAQKKISLAIDSAKIALTPMITMVGKIADIWAKFNESTKGFGTFVAGLVTIAIPALLLAWKLWTVQASAALKKTIVEATTAVTALSAEILAARNAAASIPGRPAPGTLITPGTVAPTGAPTGLLGPTGLPISTPPTTPPVPPVRTGGFGSRIGRFFGFGGSTPGAPPSGTGLKIGGTILGTLIATAIGAAINLAVSSAMSSLTNSVQSSTTNSTANDGDITFKENNTEAIFGGNNQIMFPKYNHKVTFDKGDIISGRKVGKPMLETKQEPTNYSQNIQNAAQERVSSGGMRGEIIAKFDIGDIVVPPVVFDEATQQRYMLALRSKFENLAANVIERKDFETTSRI